MAKDDSRRMLQAGHSPAETAMVSQFLNAHEQAFAYFSGHTRRIWDEAV